MTAKFVQNTTLIVKTFERKALITNFLKTVRKYYPNLRVLVADDSEFPLHPNGWSRDKITWHTLPYDSGVSARILS